MLPVAVLGVTLERSMTAEREEAPEAIPAATVIVVRDGPAGLETLMLRRDSSLEFAGGWWVFPGGRIDPGDYPAGGATDPATAARAAAVREAREEAGLEIPESDLVAFSHWMPPASLPKRFSTWFYLAPAPDGAVVIDDGEIRAHAWMAPADVLAGVDTGEIQIAPPTWISLDRIGRHRDVDAALADAGSGAVEHFVTQMTEVDGEMVALWHGDAGYDDADPHRPGPRHRLWMTSGRWRYERTEPGDG